MVFSGIEYFFKPQLLNAHPYIFDTLQPPIIESRDLAFLNANDPIYSTFSPIVMLFSAVQSSNALLSMPVVAFPIYTVLSEMHFAKANDGTEVLALNVTDTRLLHSRNGSLLSFQYVDLPNSFTVDGMLTVVSFVLPKATWPI